MSFNKFGLAVTLAGIILLDLEEVHSKSMGSLKGETLGIGWFKSEKVTWVEHSNSLCCLALVGSIVSDFFKLPPDEKLISGKQFNGRGTVGFVNGVQVKSWKSFGFTSGVHESLGGVSRNIGILLVVFIVWWLLPFIDS